jgi:hypothetical protein
MVPVANGGLIIDDGVGRYGGGAWRGLDGGVAAVKRQSGGAAGNDRLPQTV